MKRCWSELVLPITRLVGRSCRQRAKEGQRKIAPYRLPEINKESERATTKQKTASEKRKTALSVRFQDCCKQKFRSFTASGT